jgi:methyl coenzyme M reductase subunit D
MNWKVLKKSISYKFLSFNFYFEGNLEDHKELLEIKVNYIEEEIDIRVESIIIEVEEAARRLKDDLKKMKKEIIK